MKKSKNLSKWNILTWLFESQGDVKSFLVSKLFVKTLLVKLKHKIVNLHWRTSCRSWFLIIYTQNSTCFFSNGVKNDEDRNKIVLQNWSNLKENAKINYRTLLSISFFMQEYFGVKPFYRKARETYTTKQVFKYGHLAIRTMAYIW